MLAANDADLTSPNQELARIPTDDSALSLRSNVARPTVDP